MCASAYGHHYHYGDGRASSAEIYLHRLSGQEKEPHIVSMDHSYAKAWNAHPDSHHAKPAKLLFMKDIFFSESKTAARDDAPVNVESWKAGVAPPYDGSKTRSLMSECERSAGLSARTEADCDNWDENVKRVGWTVAQQRLFSQVVRLLHADRLARLAYQRSANEPVLRRLAVDRAARRLRRLLGSFSWDMKLLQWLHHLLMEKTSSAYLAAYLDILQALRAQVPSLIDKMVARPTLPARAGVAAPEALSMLLRRPWDPVAPFLSQHKPKRLPGSPLLVVCPGGPRPSQSWGPWGGLPRGKLWTSQLSVLGKLVSVNPVIPASPQASLTQVLEAMVAAVRAKLLELKSHFSSRPIILIGWMVGGLVACQVSLLESVTAVVCLGFPLVGLNGSRDVDDPLLDSHTPTLFVVGQNSLSCGIDEIENFREHMKAESGLVVVGGADDRLHMCSLKKRLEGVTQSMVDRCMLDEIGSFLQWVLSAPHMGPMGGAASSKANGTASATARRRTQSTLAENPRRVALGRRRGRQCRPYFYQQTCSGSSSTDTTPGSSPTAVISAAGVHAKRGSGRRVGRPPKQVTQKRKFATFPGRKGPLTAPRKSGVASLCPMGLLLPPAPLREWEPATKQAAMGPQMPVPIAPLTSGKGVSSPIKLHSSPYPVDPPEQSSGLDSGDLVPTSSLWSQSLIADPSSFNSSPISSPMRWFQQKAYGLAKSSTTSSPASIQDLSVPVSSPMALSSAAAHLPNAPVCFPSSDTKPMQAGPTPKSRPDREEGKFVTLAEAGIKTSLLEKRPAGITAAELELAWALAEEPSNPVCQVVLPATSALSMVVTPSGSEHLFSNNAESLVVGPVVQKAGVPKELDTVTPAGSILECGENKTEDTDALEMLAEASSSHGLSEAESSEGYLGMQQLAEQHPEIASALAAPTLQASSQGGGPSSSQSKKPLSYRHKIPFPTIASTRTRRVRMPRFYDS